MTLPSNKKSLLPEHPAKTLAKLKSDDIKGTLKAMWGQEYPADPILEPDMVGLTYGQVIIAMQFKQAAEGQGAAVDRLLDRMVGKPEQVNRNLNVNSSYKDFLEEVAREEGIIDTDGKVIDPQGPGASKH